jgi:hypothetical protein
MGSLFRNRGKVRLSEERALKNGLNLSNDGGITKLSKGNVTLTF